MSRNSYFWAMTLFGSIVLLDIAARFWRHPADFASWDYFEWGLNAALIVVIWFAYRRQLQDLDKLAEHVEEKALARMYSHAYLMVLFAYLFLLQWLTSVPRH
jgi:hypothetical protein